MKRPGVWAIAVLITVALVAGTAAAQDKFTLGMSGAT